MSHTRLRYDPDEWAYDAGQWWEPLADLAGTAKGGPSAWRKILGIDEFFDQRILGQARLFTPWICLAAAAAAASAARAWGDGASRQDDEDGAWNLAVTALELAVALQRLRWEDGIVGDAVLSTAELCARGRAALAGRTMTRTADGTGAAVRMVAGWVAQSGAHPRLPQRTAGTHRMSSRDSLSPGQAVAAVAYAVLGALPDPLAWGAAHLVERFATGTLDNLADTGKPDDPPAEAWANVPLVSEQGVLGVFEARRQRSSLTMPVGLVVPDLARLAFTHANDDFTTSVADAYAAAWQVKPPAGPGELVSWSLQPPGGGHPLAERSLSGRSAGLGAYVTFRALASLAVFAESDTAFTGQVARDGTVGVVESASVKIQTAERHHIRLVIHPRGQPWRDPYHAVELQGVRRAEDAVIAAAERLRGLRTYLQAACHLVAPEPWLQAWLDKQRPGLELPLLNVVCRHQPPAHATGAAAEMVAGMAPGLAVGRATARGVPGSPAASPAGPNPPVPGISHPEPEVPPCAAHLLARRYPRYSFAISADAGGGNTITAKRLVAEAARQALDSLRAIDAERAAECTLPLYLPLGDPPASWDELVHKSVAALSALAEPGVEISAAVASALRSDSSRTWRALVVVDGTDRARRRDDDAPASRERDLIALIAEGPGVGQRWRPSRSPQIVLCGRRGDPGHETAAEALRRDRPGTMATMTLDPLTNVEIDRFVACLSGETLTGGARELAANPLMLALSIIGGQPQVGDSRATDVFDRGIDALLGDEGELRQFLAEIAYRAATAKHEPAGEFDAADIARPHVRKAVETALADDDTELARALAIDHDERRAVRNAEEKTHLLTTSDAGWRFFHDRAFAFLVADRIARHAIGQPGRDQDVFGSLTPHLGDPLWADVIESVARLLELHGSPALA
jgi:hypothetical protein